MLAVYGTGKRTGKTAIAGEVARRAARRGLAPIVIAMGRGGPPEPQVAEAGSVTLDRLIGLVAGGGARRVGLPGGRPDHGRDHDRGATGGRRVGGRSLRDQRRGGRRDRRPTATPVSSSSRGAGRRCRPSPGTRGSWSSRPTARRNTSAAIWVRTACCGPTWLLLPCQRARFPGPRTSPSFPLTCAYVRRCAGLGDRLPPGAARRCAGTGRVLRNDRPDRDRRNPGAASGDRVRGPDRRVEREAGRPCRPGGGSRDAGGYDVLLTELKAAAVDVACRHAAARGAEVVFVDNRAEVTEGSTDSDNRLRRGHRPGDR